MKRRRIADARKCLELDPGAFGFLRGKPAGSEYDRVEDLHQTRVVPVPPAASNTF